MHDLGGRHLVRTVRWGALTERRFALPSGLEVEVGVGSPAWATVQPLDAGMREVASGGLRAVYDPQLLLAGLLAACSQASGPGG